jgi:hypothetical protein
MEASPTDQRRERILSAGVVVGLLLTLTGLGWMAFSKPSHVWSSEQAAEFKAASEALHDARRGGQADHPQKGGPTANDAAVSGELTAAQARFDRIEAELTEARAGRHRMGSWLIRIGLAAMIVFGVGYLASQRH